MVDLLKMLSNVCNDIFGVILGDIFCDVTANHPCIHYGNELA
jgi:hypothetical protein